MEDARIGLAQSRVREDECENGGGEEQDAGERFGPQKPLKRPQRTRESPHRRHSEAKSAAALSKRILRRTASERGSERKSSTFRRIERTPFEGQSVPHRTRSAISEIRGRTSRSFRGGIPEMSSRTFGWRLARKNAVSYQRGRPAWQRTRVVAGKSTATSSHAIGSA